MVLHEQRPFGSAPAHHTDALAELVCSNSFKSQRHDSAAGLLKEELGLMGCALLPIARECSVPAGGALAVDRISFSDAVTRAIAARSNISLVREEVTSIPRGRCVIAAGPLCSESLFASLTALVGSDALSFFDAAAPIVDAESIDRSIAFSQSRYQEDGLGDYLNCPMDKDRYVALRDALVNAGRVVMHDFESKDLFQACQPVEEVARTGVDSLRFGALKPVGLTDPATGRRPWAAVQLRAENADLTAYNLVGFQTNLTFSEQARVFRMIPGLEHAEFFRYGVMHRNSFVDSPRVLDPTFRVPGTQVCLAGQITGTEGYTEAIASGFLAALNTYADVSQVPGASLPATGALGSLVAYATNPSTCPYQPMHVNFGLFPPLADTTLKKRARYQAYADRAMTDLSTYVRTRPDLFAGSSREGL